MLYLDWHNEVYHAHYSVTVNGNNAYASWWWHINREVG
jgi:hypothetical protein